MYSILAILVLGLSWISRVSIRCCSFNPRTAASVSLSRSILIVASGNPLRASTMSSIAYTGAVYLPKLAIVKLLHEKFAAASPHHHSSPRWLVQRSLCRGLSGVDFRRPNMKSNHVIAASLRPNGCGNGAAAKNYDFKARVIGGSRSPHGSVVF